jgi:hypothetical protein
MTAYLTNLPKNNSKNPNASPLNQRIANEASHLSFYATAKIANLASVKGAYQPEFFFIHFDYF